MIFNGVFLPSCYEDEAFDAASPSLFNHKLDEGFVDDWQHFFGIAFVAGRNLVPRPPIGKTAVLILAIVLRSRDC